MAIDLQAIAEMHKTRKETSENAYDKLEKSLVEAYKQNNLEQKKYTALEGKQVDSVLGTINYSSSMEDINNAIRINDEWLVNANNRETNSKDRKLNNAIHEAKSNAIDRVSQRANEYSGLNNKVDNLWTELQSLKTSENEEYDFTEISNVLNDYKNTGENILSYNSKWVDKEEYKRNVSSIQDWIRIGKKFQAMDVDPVEMQVFEEKELITPEQIIQHEAVPEINIENAGMQFSDISLALTDMVRMDDFEGINSMLETIGSTRDLSDEQVELLTKAKSSISTSENLFSSIQSTAGTSERINAAGETEEISGFYYQNPDDPGNPIFMDYTNASQLNRTAYGKAGEDVMSFLNTFEGSVIPGIDAFEEIVPAEYKITETERMVGEGIQLDEKYKDQPYYQMLIDQAFDEWKLGDDDMAESSMKMAIQYMVEGQRNIDSAMRENDKNVASHYANTVIPAMDDNEYTAMQRAMQNYQDGNMEHFKNEVSRMDPTHQVIVSRMVTQQGTNWDGISNAFHDKGVSIIERKEDEKLASAFSIVNNINMGLGEGTGTPLAVDPKLVTGNYAIKNPFTTKIQHGHLENAGTRKETIGNIGQNVEKIFKYLNQGIMGGGFSDTPDLHADRLTKGEFTPGTYEWYKAMDAIAAEYLVKGMDGYTRNQATYEETVNQFAGGSGVFFTNNEEINGYVMLERNLKAYLSLRDLDVAYGTDITDPLGLGK